MENNETGAALYFDTGLDVLIENCTFMVKFQNITLSFYL